MNSPVVSQLTTPHVARQYGEREDNNLFIRFGTEKRYIPSVMLYRLDVPLFLEDTIAQILDSELLTVSHPSNCLNTIKQEVQKCCASSPAALRHALQKVIDTPGKNSFEVEFLVSQAERSQYLAPIINELKKIDYERDTKLLVLCKLLEELTSEKKKGLFSYKYAKQ